MSKETDFSQIPQDLLAEAFESLAEGIAVYDADERLVVFNQRYRQLLGKMADMIHPGMHWRDLIHGCVQRGVVSKRHDSGDDWVERSERQRDGDEQETEIRQLDGRSYEISYHKTRSGGFVVTRSDITEKRRAESLAQDRDSLLTTILETNPIPVVMARLEDAKIVYKSPAATKLLGETDCAVDYFATPSDRAAYVAALRRTGKVEDYIVRTTSLWGKEIVISLSGSLTEYNGEPCVVSSITDLTERIEREAMIRKVVESCPVPIQMTLADSGDVLFKSPEVTAMFGSGEGARSYYLNPRDRLEYLRDLRRTREVIDYRVRLVNAEGKPFWAAVSARLIDWDGKEVIVSHTRDLTAQLTIEGELNRQREQVFQNEKMSALGGLLAGVAHELNNPLSVVVGHAMMLEDEAGDEVLKRKSRKISDAAQRCARIVKTFLTMARQEPTRMEETDIAEVVETAVEVARYGDTSGANIVLDQSGNIDRICADPDQITQVLINLILNAEQAMQAAGKGDTIRISTGPCKEGRGVRIEVEDNGPGISADLRARIFEPFFTTKGVGKGTGIGLSMCHRIVSAHEGMITAEASDEGGARFVVTLPCNTTSERAETAKPAQAEDTGICRVLVIDDETEVADLNAEVLSRGGFEATVVYRGVEAKPLLETGDFDVVISDLNMPEMDGRGVFEMIKADFPHLADRVGFITGDTLGQTSQTFLAESQRPFLEKPVSPRELREFVSRLNERQAAE